MRTLALWLSLIMIFAIPWENSITLPGLGTISRLLGALVVGFWMATVVVTGKIRQPRPFHLVVFLFIIWNMLSVFWSIDVNLTKSRVTTYIQLFILIFILWDLFTTSTALKAGLQAYVLGDYVSALSMIKNYLSGVSLNVQGRYTVAGFNENAIGVILVLGIPIASYLALTEGQGKGTYLLRLINYLYIPIGLMGAILSGSRGPIFAAVPAFLFMLVSLNQLKLYIRVLIFVALIGTLFSLQFFIPAESIHRLGTAGDEISNGTLNGRTVIWSQGLTAFADHPILGVGSGAYRVAVASGIIAHNFAISLLAEVGLVGFGLFISALAIIFFQTKYQPKLEARFWIALLSTWILGASTSNFEYRKQSWLIFGLAIVATTLFLKPTVPSQIQPVSFTQKDGF